MPASQVVRRLIVLLLLGCRVPGLPHNAIRFSPPIEYHEWWASTEACAGVQSPFDSVRWYVVPKESQFTSKIGPVVALWFGDSGRVSSTIVVAAFYQTNELVVRHEILHALLHHEGHPFEYFVERCKLTWETWHAH